MTSRLGPIFTHHGLHPLTIGGPLGSIPRPASEEIPTREADLGTPSSPLGSAMRRAFFANGPGAIPRESPAAPKDLFSIIDGIYSDIHNLQGVLRIGPIEERIRSFADKLDLHRGVQIYRKTPSAHTAKLHAMLNLSTQIPKLMNEIIVMDDDTDFKETTFREIMHSQHSREAILTYIDRAKRENYPKAIPVLERILELYDQVYNGEVDWEIIAASLGRAVKDQLELPSELTLKNLGPTAISIRDYFETYGESLSTENRYLLIRTAIALDVATYGLCVLKPEEINTSIQARKIGILIEVLYGSGCGEPVWLKVADRLRELAEQWETLPEERRTAELHRYGVLAFHFLQETRTSYHSLFDPIVRERGSSWGLTDEEIRDFTRSLYRTSGLFPLGQHLSALGVHNGNPARVKQILACLKEGLSVQYPFRSIFLGEGASASAREMGNKGKGLDELTRLGEPVPPGFVLPPLRLQGKKLSEGQVRTIKNALLELERRTGKSFSDGTLQVSVRSGAAISMPGELTTVPKLKSVEEILEAVVEVYESWEAHGASTYRKLNGIPDELGTAVVVQEWITTTDSPDSGFGIATSHTMDQSYLGVRVRYGKQIEGFDLVSGRNPGEDSPAGEILFELGKRIRRYEEIYHHPVEVEFAVGQGNLWVLQIRRAQFEYADEIVWAADRVQRDPTAREATIAFLGGRDRLIAAKSAQRLRLSGLETRLTDEARGGGRPTVGQIALSGETIHIQQAAGLLSVFVTDDPDAGHTAACAFEAGAVIFHGGNGVSHLEGDLSASDRPHLGGIPVLVDRASWTVKIGNFSLKEDDTITLDPANGSIYLGKVPIEETSSRLSDLIDWLLEGNG